MGSIIFRILQMRLWHSNLLASVSSLDQGPRNEARVTVVLSGQASALLRARQTGYQRYGWYEAMKNQHVLS